MIKWYPKLYMDEEIKKKQKKVKKLLEKEKITLSIYCIVFASNPENLFDIICANELYFAHSKRNTVFILGLAQSRESAIKLVQVIIQEVYDNKKNVDVRSYFSNLMKEVPASIS